jgi:hypothetical protein
LSDGADGANDCDIREDQEQACVRACRSPLGFLVSDWSDGLVAPISGDLATDSHLGQETVMI